jgi:glycosyltransferase involved in cell wall biosynthesis
MHIVHVTPHLPPDQAANALLPYHLGQWAVARGDSVHYVAHPPVAGRPAALPGPVTWIPRKRAGGGRWLRLGSIASAWRVLRHARPFIEAADIVHVHSNGLLAELGALLALRSRKPFVLTLYGTEIWHYRPKQWGPDLFTRAYRAAAAVTFYSDRLLLRARELGLGRPECHVIYPAVGPAFAFHDEASQLEKRHALGLTYRHLLVNVKRLHPLAGQRFLIEAMGEVVREHPDCRLVICGTGALLAELQSVARSAGVERHVTFAGLVDNATVARYTAAADFFVLPSLLEALPTVAVEALACGTPVISSDNPGGLELNDLFGDDVEIVRREDSQALADAIRERLRAKRRTLPSTHAIVETRFRAEAVAAEYWSVYARATAGVVT